MAWLQIAFDVDIDDAQRVAEFLENVGALAVTMQESQGAPVFEPPLGEAPLWATTKVIGLFETTVDSRALLIGVGELLHPKPLPEYRLIKLADKAWEREWLDDFKPMQFGRRLWIVPTVYEAKQADAINIRLDPGLAFGTGTHETTALCLEWLDNYLAPGCHVVDYGCGSGILSIAALKLGAKSVNAIDIDPQALQATMANAKANEVEFMISAGLPNAFNGGQFDVLVANILANPLIALEEDFASYVSVGGKIVLSGILFDQADEVIKVYSDHFTMDLIRRKNEWCLVSGTRIKSGS